MAGSSIATDWNSFQRESKRLEDLIASMWPLGPRYRKVIAEIVLIRLFLLAENTVESICLKLVAGAQYLDGSLPMLLARGASKASAKALIVQHGRGSPRKSLSWGSAKAIRDNLKYTVDASDQLFRVVSNYGNLLTEMRRVRNHVAHNNASTRVHFRNVVRNHYGGLRRGISPGVLLLTRTWGRPVVLERYVRGCRVMIKDLARR